MHPPQWNSSFRDAEMIPSTWKCACVIKLSILKDACENIVLIVGVGLAKLNQMKCSCVRWFIVLFEHLNSKAIRCCGDSKIFHPLLLLLWCLGNQWGHRPLDIYSYSEFLPNEASHTLQTALSHNVKACTSAATNLEWYNRTNTFHAVDAMSWWIDEIKMTIKKCTKCPLWRDNTDRQKLMT